MPEESSRSVLLGSAPPIAFGALYGVWAARFIALSAVETNDGRYFCLFDDAMVPFATPGISRTATVSCGIQASWFRRDSPHVRWNRLPP